MNVGLKSKPGIVSSTQNYDSWLLALEPAFAHDLKQKFEVMAGDPGDFLRATFYRWSERFVDLCPEAASAPAARAVGDVHVGNFGTWHDRKGRLRWGLNDFDEACWIPFTNDLTRLATSALLARNDLDPQTVERMILSGYSDRVARGELGALDLADDSSLRKATAAAQMSSQEYYKKLAGKDVLDGHDAKALRSLCTRLQEDVPGGLLHHRRAGRGSLGRVRIFALSKTDPVFAIEAKRVLRSAWSWARRGGPASPDPADDRNDDLVSLLTDKRRRPDRETTVEKIDKHRWVLRPLSPDRVGIDFGDVDDVSESLASQLLDRMGAEVAHIHLLSQDAERLASYLAQAEPGWLGSAADAMKVDTENDFHVWKKYRRASDKRPT
jgi:Uncharacterized protein conserved in bacteria (DUF2252)